MICRICNNFACFCPDRDYDFNDHFYGSKNCGVPRDIHVMNKAEGKLCRKLMSETGLTEEELREHKKYRIMLSEAQKEGQKGLDRIAKQLKMYMKQATKQTGLAKEHPETKRVFEELLKRYNKLHYIMYL